MSDANSKDDARPDDQGTAPGGAPAQAQAGAPNPNPDQPSIDDPFPTAATTEAESRAQSLRNYADGIEHLAERQARHRKRVLTFFLTLLALFLVIGVYALITVRTETQVIEATANVAASEAAKKIASSELEDVNITLASITKDISTLSEKQQSQETKIGELEDEEPTPIRVPYYPMGQQAVRIIREIVPSESSPQHSFNLTNSAADPTGGPPPTDSKPTLVTPDYVKTYVAQAQKQYLKKEDVEGPLAEVNLAAHKLNTVEAASKELIYRLQKLEDRLAALEKSNTPAGAGRPRPSSQLTYEAKENSETRIYNLNLKITVGRQKEGRISVLRVTHLIEGWTHEVKDVEMGRTINFSQEKRKYQITPTYISRRKLFKDFIGLIINIE